MSTIWPLSLIDAAMSLPSKLAHLQYQLAFAELDTNSFIYSFKDIENITYSMKVELSTHTNQTLPHSKPISMLHLALASVSI